MELHDILVRPLVTEKGIIKKDEERTLCFQVARDANKIQVKKAVEKLEEVRTANFEGKLRRRGRFAAYRSDWKKAYVRVEAGQKVPEFTEM
jgi:large subunit ribosomal protein L23